VFLPCFGSISFWKMALKGHTIYVNHTFQKQTDLSQFQIVGPNGRLKLSIPTVKSTRKGSYQNVAIDYNSKWQIEHWRSIENAYLKSPFFLYYGYKIEPIFKQKHQNLYELNLALFEVINQCIKSELTFNIDGVTAQNYSENILEDFEEYPQVFDAKLGFESNLSILDILFNLGPETLDFLT
jgi:hypothetical protein